MQTSWIMKQIKLTVFLVPAMQYDIMHQKKLNRSLNQMTKLYSGNVYATIEVPSKIEVALRFALLSLFILFFLTLLKN